MSLPRLTWKSADSIESSSTSPVSTPIDRITSDLSKPAQGRNWVAQSPLKYYFWSTLFVAISADLVLEAAECIMLSLNSTFA